MERSRNSDMTVYVFSRGTWGGLSWAEVAQDGAQLGTPVPSHFEELESLIDVSDTALVLAECERRELCLLIWGIPSNRVGNGGLQIRSSLLLIWPFHGEPSYIKASSAARATAAAWLDERTRGQFINLLSDHITEDDADQAGSGMGYRVADSFYQTLVGIITDSLEFTKRTVQDSLQKLVDFNSPAKKQWLARALRDSGLPRERSQIASCSPIVIVTRNAVPVQGVQVMLTALPDIKPDARAGTEGSGEHSGSSRLALPNIEPNAKARTDHRTSRSLLRRFCPPTAILAGALVLAGAAYAARNAAHDQQDEDSQLD